MKSCPFDYVNHEDWLNRVKKWNKDHPERCKESVKKSILKKKLKVYGVELI